MKRTERISICCEKGFVAVSNPSKKPEQYVKVLLVVQVPLFLFRKGSFRVVTSYSHTYTVMKETIMV